MICAYSLDNTVWSFGNRKTGFRRPFAAIQTARGELGFGHIMVTVSECPRSWAKDQSVSLVASTVNRVEPSKDRHNVPPHDVTAAR